MDYVFGGGHKTMAKCRICDQNYWACPNKPQGNHVCRGPVIVEGDNFQRRVLTCRNCGTRYYEGTRHVCPQTQKPTVTTGNPTPTSVGNPNPTSLKLASFNQQNIIAIQETIISPLIDKQIDEIKKGLGDDAIAIVIGDVSTKTNPPLTQKETDDLMKAIRDGDSDQVQNILQGKDVTSKDLSTLTGLADAKNLIKKYDTDGTIKQSELKKLLDTLGNGNQNYLGGLLTDMKKLGKINKISHILDLASLALGGGSSTTIPTGVVAIVTFPDLPFGVIFPLGNGVWGMGTGGKGQTGIWQGYIPQPPVYGADKVTFCELETGQEPSLVLRNDTGKEVKYYVEGKVDTLGGNHFTTWCNAQSRIQVRLPSGRGNTYTTSNVNPGAYEFVEAANGSWKLEEEKTEFTINNTGNPIPFTFFIGTEKYVIEPGKLINLNDPNGGNAIYEIQFARSADVSDVIRYAIGGKRTFNVGKDQSDGKWALFQDGAKPAKPATPQQNTLPTSQALVYDDTPISASNVGGLPVLPSYD